MIRRAFARSGAPVVMPHLESELADPDQGWINFRSFFFTTSTTSP